MGAEPGYKNAGSQWLPTKSPVRVGVHDFPDPNVPKAIPYSVYDVGANTDWVSVGADGDTAAFAVETLRRWWIKAGQRAYPKARRLLVTADSGGSNSYRGKHHPADPSSGLTQRQLGNRAKSASAL